MSIVYKIIKRVVIALFSILVAGVICLIAWRILSSGDPKSMKGVWVNDAVAEVYAQRGESMELFRQEQRSVTSAKNNYGYFSVTSNVIIPEANQIQTVIRYNTSTLKYTAEDFELEEIPSRYDDVYDVTLLLAIDLTPDVEEDNLGNDEESVRFVRVKGEQVKSDTKNMYNYRRMVFDVGAAEIDLKELIDSGLLLAVYIDFCYNGQINYDEPYGTLCLYDFASANKPVELTRSDIKALEAYGK